MEDGTGIVHIAPGCGGEDFELSKVHGLAILTPIFTADLRHAETPAKEAIASLVLDAPLPASTKVDLAERRAGSDAEYVDSTPDVADDGPYTFSRPRRR